jgi:hypothetical protein
MSNTPALSAAYIAMPFDFLTKDSGGASQYRFALALRLMMEVFV